MMLQTPQNDFVDIHNSDYLVVVYQLLFELLFVTNPPFHFQNKNYRGF